MSLPHWSCVCAFALLAFALHARADEMIRRVQEELRRRQLFFGEVDGRHSIEVEQALQRYQKRKGFSETGHVDDVTLKSLGLPTKQPVTGSVELPDGPILKSDERREVSDVDRQFLEKLGNGESLPAISEPPEPTPTPTPQLAAASPASSPAPPPAESWPDPTAFLRSYLDAAESNDLAAEMQFYAEPLDYFDHGVVNHDFVGKDVQRYYKRWPNRHYELVRVHSAAPAEGANERTIQFRLRFDLRNGDVSAKGQTDNVFRVRRTPEGLKFFYMREQRVREGGGDVSSQ